ncbi:hypothetical protein ACQ86G_20995 [Roseateles chitinivorans]|uniref:hypothetical protein n=1 Tax=Roseateles chitinivorans TaxID=2917965 RepID=UPI003D666EF8
MGRALLWATALTDCRDCLDLAQRLQGLPASEALHSTEAQSAARHLIRLAIVYFGQLYTVGYEDGAAVASNKQMAVELDALEREAFPHHVDLAKFQALRDLLMELRHGTIAHADGKAFSVQHESNSARALTPLLDPALHDEFRDSCARLIVALLRHAAKIADVP